MQFKSGNYFIKSIGRNSWVIRSTCNLHKRAMKYVDLFYAIWCECECDHNSTFRLCRLYSTSPFILSLGSSSFILFSLFVSLTTKDETSGMVCPWPSQPRDLIIASFISAFRGFWNWLKKDAASNDARDVSSGSALVQGISAWSLIWFAV